MGRHCHLFVVFHLGLLLSGGRADDGDPLLLGRLGHHHTPLTVPQMSVDSLQILDLVLAVITNVRIVHFGIEILVVSLGSNFVLGSVSTFCGIQMVMHSMHRAIMDPARVTN